MHLLEEQECFFVLSPKICQFPSLSTCAQRSKSLNHAQAQGAVVCNCIPVPIQNYLPSAIVSVKFWVVNMKDGTHMAA